MRGSGCMRVIDEPAEHPRALHHHAPRFGHLRFNPAEHRVQLENRRFARDIRLAEIQFVPAEHRIVLRARKVLIDDHTLSAAEYRRFLLQPHPRLRRDSEMENRSPFQKHQQSDPDQDQRPEVPKIHRQRTREFAPETRRLRRSAPRRRCARCHRSHPRVSRFRSRSESPARTGKHHRASTMCRLFSRNRAPMPISTIAGMRRSAEPASSRR